MAFSGVPRSDLVWKRRPSAELDLRGRKVAVVGGTAGIGQALARLMAARGAEVTVVGQTFRDEGTAGIKFLRADLSSMAEARRVAKALAAESLDLVVLTNGIIAAPKRQETAEGLERDMAVSYLSRLVLVQELAPRLGTQAGRRARVFIMGFPGTDAKPVMDDLNAERSYSAMPVHMSTVAGNEALVLDSAKRHSNADFYGLNPGLIKTNIRSNLLGEGLRFRATEWVIGLLTPSVAQYAERIVPLLVTPELDGQSGALFNAKGVAIQPSRTMPAEVVRELIEKSQALVERALSRASAA